MTKNSSDTLAERDADKSVQRTPAEPKFPQVLRLPLTPAKLNEPRVKEKNTEGNQVSTALGLDFLMQDIPVPEFRVLAISGIEVGVQILPVDAGTVEALKEAFSIDRQVVAVSVRKHKDGRYELISGCADIPSSRIMFGLSGRAGARPSCRWRIRLAMRRWTLAKRWA